MCVASCAKSCLDGVYLRAHIDFCVDNGLVTGTAPASARDAAECERLFPAAEVQPPANPEGGTATPIPPAQPDCGEFERPSDRIRCERQGVRPSCSESVVTLEGDAALLVTEVGLELSKYGEILQRDMTDVSSRTLLCEFSLDQLDGYYINATEDPEGLRTIQRRADGIQACQAEWETYVRTNAANDRLSDSLPDDVAREMDAQFAPLREQLQNLSSSITKLEQAAGTIEQLIGIHIDFCPPGGTKAD